MERGMHRENKCDFKTTLWTLQGLSMRKTTGKKSIKWQSPVRLHTNPATNWQETVVNLGESTAQAGSDTILRTELSMLRSQIKACKQEFGVTLY